MKKTMLMGLIVVAAIAATTLTSTGTSNLAFANPKTDDPDLVGHEAAELAQCKSDCLGEDDTNKGAMGEHSSGQDEPRNGLANALTEHGEPQHPSEVIQKLCGEEGQNCP
jgi:hypothetical protein